ncbi:MAG: hypothetical protein M3Q31_15510 [Actinomycetota bacterium]|nr:hypothetical protein [Actinomycetota bacterium]
MRLVRFIACLAALVTVAAGCHTSSDKAGGSAYTPAVVLRLAAVSGLPPAPVLAWIDAVERRSRGSIRIDVLQSWRLGDQHGEEHVLRDLRSGRVDLAWVGVRVFDRVGVRNFQPLLAPFLIDSYELEARVFADPLVRRRLERAKLPGVAVIGVLPGPMRRIAGFAHPFREPLDFRGRLVGLQDSALADAALRALGARPRPEAGGLPVSGLDAYEQQVGAMPGNGLDRMARYVTANADLWPRPLAIVASARALARLEPAQRSLFRDALSAVLPHAVPQAVAEDIGATNAICRSGMRQATASKRQLERLRAAVAPIYRTLAADAETRPALRRIESLKRTTAAPPATLLPCSAFAGARASDRETPLDGSYTLATSASDLPAASPQAEEYGAWEIVLDRGRFRLSQASDGADWVADGSARVSGDTLTLTALDALDVGPHGAPDGLPWQAGDRLRFRWRRHAAQLTLRSLDPHPALPSLAIRALQRRGDAPGQQQLVDPAPLVGRWTTDVTARDMIAHGADPTGIPDNTGPITLAIAATGCSWQQRSPDGPHYSRGRCRFAGRTLELDWTAWDSHSAAAPYFFEWSVFHDRLTLRRSTGFSPEGWAFHPWRRET